MDTWSSTGARPERGERGAGPSVTPRAAATSALYQTLAEAAGELAPVVIAVHGSPARYGAFLEGLVGRRADRWLRVAPVAAAALPSEASTPLTVRATEADWTLRASRWRRVDDQTLDLAISGAWLEHRSDRTRPRHRRTYDDPLLLVAPVGAGEPHAFPVVDVSHDTCSVDAAEGVAEGTTLEPLEIVGDDGILRRSRGSILESIPWYTPQRERRFRLRIALSPATSPEVEEDAYDIMEDPKRVRRVIDLATLLGAEATVSNFSSWARAPVLSSSASTVTLGAPVASTAIGATKPGQSLRLVVELFTISYEGQVRVTGGEHDELHVSLPLLLRRRRRRCEPRVAVPICEAPAVEFTNPLTRQRVSRPVADLSISGLSFHQRQDEDILWEGLHLDDGLLRVGPTPIPLGTLDVRAVCSGADHSLCRSQLRHNPAGRNAAYCDFVEAVRHPQLTHYRGGSFEEMLDFYKRARVLAPFMEANARRRYREAEACWKKVHREGDSVCRTTVQREEGRPVASVTAMHWWDGTWVGQHVGALPDRRGKSAGRLFIAYLDHLLLRPDCRFMVFFATTANAKMNSIHGRFLELTGTPEAFTRLVMDYWLYEGYGGEPLPDGVSVEPLRQEDETLVARAAARTFGPLGAAAMSMTPGRFELPETTDKFRDIGLQRERRVRVVRIGGVPRMALVEERATPGLNLAEMMGATWLVPLHLERVGGELGVSDTTMQHALQAALRPSERTLIFSHESLRPVLPGQGRADIMSVYMYMLNRAGLRRYAHYLAEAYGEINARRKSKVASE